ncbi:MAG: hypothetical protein ACYTXA_02560 [Nostoc sp.]
MFDETAKALMMHWEDPSGAMSGWEALSVAIQPTALPMLLKSERLTSEFALAQADTTTIGFQLIAHIHPWLAVLQEGEHLDLSVHLATLLQSQELGCRDDKDYILVSLLLLKSLIGERAVGDIAIWSEALIRFTEGLPLYLTRRDGMVEWL